MRKTQVILTGLAIFLLLISVISPVIAAEERMDVNDKQINDDLYQTQEKFSHFSHEGYDEKHRCPVQVPASYTEVENLTIDSSLTNATPHWFFLAAGKTEQTALLSYIRNANVKPQKKVQWSLFMMKSWMKYPVKYIKTENGATLVVGKTPYKFSMTPQENRTFQEIERYIAEDMAQSETSKTNNRILPRFVETEHIGFTAIACSKENLPSDLAALASTEARTPDTWYNYPGGIAVHSLEHGYVPYSGLGLAPLKCQEFASDARSDFLSHNYQSAFTKLGYSTHFIEDMGMPYHTPAIQLIPLQFIDDPTYIKQTTITGMVLDYYSLHNAYETFVDNYWTTPLPNNQQSFSVTANAPGDYYTVSSPLLSAHQQGYDSWIQNYNLVYDCYWQKIKTGTYDFENNPAIIAITKERVYHTTEYTRGLVRYVTGGQTPTLTISSSAGSGGSISPPGAVSVNYGDTPTFTITPDSGYIISDVVVDGVSMGARSSYTFPPVISDRTISATFKQNLPTIIPLCKAGDAFDATKYPQDWPQSDPMTFECEWDGNGRVYLSGDKSSLIGTHSDDGFTVDTPNGIQFDAEGHWAHQHPPLEITSGMNKGSNTLTLIVRNWMGLSMSYGSYTGIGVDQEPWIIEVNSPTTTVAVNKATTDELPSFITRTDNGLMVNGTIIS